MEYVDQQDSTYTDLETTQSNEDEVANYPYWLILLGSSLLPFFALALLTLLFKFVTYLMSCCISKKPAPKPSFANERLLGSNEQVYGYAKTPEKPEKRKCRKLLADCFTKLKGKSTLILLGQSIGGQILITVTCGFCIVDLVIYLIDVLSESYFKFRVEFTTSVFFFEDKLFFTDFVSYCFFFALFCFKFFTTNNSLKFFFEMQTIVDFATIPPVFVEFYLGQYWLGLRFFRCFRLLLLPDLLQYLRIIRDSDRIRLTQLLSIFLSMWIASAGFIFLLENSGDEGAGTLGFGSCLYYIMVTISTVGYGDICPATVFGKIFIVLFILVALAIFASFLPEIIDIISRLKKSEEMYKPTKGIKHVVVSGHINYKVVHNYLKNFHHQDRDLDNLKSVFLDNGNHDLALQSLFKRNSSKIVFIQGSLMHINDMKNVALEEADACLVIANVTSNKPDEEDATNIMRLISIKNYLPETRVVIQLLRFNNKVFCLNLPFWTSRDQAICISELKLGIMGSACLVPGFPTLILNLTTMISSQNTKNLPKWKKDYLHGAGMEIYIKNFSPSFYEKSFSQAVYTCYTKLKLVLFALITKEGSCEKVVINPSDDFTIKRDTKGFFICESDKEANRVTVFCESCHQTTRLDRIKKCPCDARSMAMKKKKFKSLTSKIDEFKNNNYKELEKIDFDNPTQLDLLVLNDTKVEANFESTGLFYWQPMQNFEDCILTAETTKHLRSHVVLCCTESSVTTLNGLSNFVMPLRASSLAKKDLRPILIFIDDFSALQSEWMSLGHFPLLYVFKGNCLERSHLRAVQIEFCHMCVIMTSSVSCSEDQSLIDKAAVMTNLIIKTMTSSNVMRRYNAREFRTAIGVFNTVLLQNNALDEVRKNNLIPVLCEIADEGNTQFLDQDDEDDEQCPLYLTQPFACSTAFVSRVLDTLMYSIYFTPQLLNLVRCLISGGDIEELEQMSTDGIGWSECNLTAKKLRKRRNRSYLTLIGYDDFPSLKPLPHLYGELFIALLTEGQFLSLGVYRQMAIYDTEYDESVSTEHSKRRFVITNPSSDFSLHQTDKIFCLRLCNAEIKNSTQESNIF